MKVYELMALLAEMPAGAEIEYKHEDEDGEVGTIKLPSAPELTDDGVLFFSFVNAIVE